MGNWNGFQEAEASYFVRRTFAGLVFMAFTATLITPITLKTLLRLQGKKELIDSEYSAAV